MGGEENPGAQGKRVYPFLRGGNDWLEVPKLDHRAVGIFGNCHYYPCLLRSPPIFRYFSLHLPFRSRVKKEKRHNFPVTILFPEMKEDEIKKECGTQKLIPKGTCQKNVGIEGKGFSSEQWQKGRLLSRFCWTVKKSSSLPRYATVAAFT